MNKKKKVLLVGGIVLLVLVGVLAALLLFSPEEEEGVDSSSSDSTVNLLEKNINTLTKLTIKNEKDEIVMTQSEDGVFAVEALKGLPTDQSSVKEVFSAMAVIDAVKVVSDSPENLEEYGLADPKTVVEATQKDGERYSLKIGVKSPLNDGYYAMLDGDPKLYLVQINPYGYLSTKAGKDYLSKALTSNDEGKEVEELVQKITLSREDTGRELVFEQVENDAEAHYSPMYASAFVMTSPVKAYVESTYFGDVADAAVSFDAASVVGIFPTQEQLGEYGLLEPTAVYTAFMKDGSQVQVKVGKACYSDPAAEDEKAGTEITGYYVQLVGRDAVYYARTGQMPFLTTTVFDMISQIPFAPNITQVDTLTISAEGVEYLIDFVQTETGSDSNSVEVTGTVNGKEVDKDKLANFYIYVVSALANELYTETPAGSPILTLTFRFNDASLSPLTVAFHDVGDRKASITVNGQTRFATRMAYVTAFFENVKAIAANQAINPNY
ncbi:MAG: DUF4340 domain-containing protein [Oscillospiraceae bacterium]|nr:DUF4340 domain-containing protein [Oscillospiraceae bacterium]